MVYLYKRSAFHVLKFDRRGTITRKSFLHFSNQYTFDQLLTFFVLCIRAF